MTKPPGARTAVWRSSINPPDRNVRPQRALGLAAALCAAGVVAPVWAQDEPLPDRRAVTAPVVSAVPVTGKPLAARDSAVDMLQQLDELQNELKELRNAVEVQAHELTQLKSRQRDLLEDLDRRVRDLEGRAPRADAAAPAAAGDGAPRVPAAPLVLKPASVQQRKEYDAAFDLMKQGHYEKAIKGFREFVAKYPDVSLSDNAQYWIAEGTYVQRQYRPALDEFAKVLSLYPGSPKAPDALLKIGFAHYELGDYPRARKALSDVIARYPESAGARLAQARLDKMKGEGR